MPRSVPLNGFFLYLRDQAASAARSGRGPDPNKGVGASAYAPYPAPSGFRWDFVTYSGSQITYSGAPVVALIGA